MFEFLTHAAWFCFGVFMGGMGVYMYIDWVNSPTMAEIAQLDFERSDNEQGE